MGLYLVQSILVKLNGPVSHAYVWNKSLFNGLHQQCEKVIASMELRDPMVVKCNANPLPSPILQLLGGAALSDRAVHWRCPAE